MKEGVWFESACLLMPCGLKVVDRANFALFISQDRRLSARQYSRCQ
jgi:hypothetical protein